MWKSLLGPLLVLFSVFVAYLGIRNARAVARQKATLDIIEKFESTEHYRALNDAFSTVRRSNGFGTLHDPRTEADRDARAKVQDYLNHYELVAIGIRNNILDARIYQAWMASAVIRDWNAATSFIQRERWRLNDAHDDFVYHPALYANYQWLASRFSGEAIKLGQGSSTKPQVAQAGGLGDDPLPLAEITPSPPDSGTIDRVDVVKSAQARSTHRYAALLLGASALAGVLWRTAHHRFQRTYRKL